MSFNWIPQFFFFFTEMCSVLFSSVGLQHFILPSVQERVFASLQDTEQQTSKANLSWIHTVWEMPLWWPGVERGTDRQTDRQIVGQTDRQTDSSSSYCQPSVSYIVMQRNYIRLVHQKLSTGPPPLYEGYKSESWFTPQNKNSRGSSLAADVGFCEGLSWLVFGAFGRERFADFFIYRDQWLTVVPEQRIIGECGIFFLFHSHCKNNLTNSESNWRQTGRMLRFCFIITAVQLSFPINTFHRVAGH